MLTKTQELAKEADKLILRTTIEEAAEVTAQSVKELDEGKAREILYVENDIRVLQARLAALQGEKAKTAELAATAVELAPVKVEEKPLKGGAIKVG